MRVVNIIAITALVSLVALWLGKYKYFSKKNAVLITVLCIGLGGGSLLAAVLPNTILDTNIIVGREIKDSPGNKIITLTFDDGPYSPYTQQILEALKRADIKATFFMVAEEAEKQPNLVKAVVTAGHEIGLHANEHKDYLKLSHEEAYEEISIGKKILERLTGQPVKYWRPPHGFKDTTVFSVAEKTGLTIVNWTVSPRDWTGISAEEIATRTLQDAKNGNIVLLHDGDSPKKQASRIETIKAIPLIAKDLREAGFNFVTVTENINARK